MRILFDSRWIAPHGIGRVAREYRDRLARDFDLVELIDGPKPSSPMDWWFLGQAFRRSGADLLSFRGIMERRSQDDGNCSSFTILFISAKPNRTGLGNGSITTASPDWLPRARKC
ncbi:MAG: hypothetical protein IPI83_15020 [Sphingomonadales bacterium]|nr:hypothetical protein [Sphingomonadales bacterium]